MKSDSWAKKDLITHKVRPISIYLANLRLHMCSCGNADEEEGRWMADVVGGSLQLKSGRLGLLARKPPVKTCLWQGCSGFGRVALTRTPASGLQGSER
jgi:hypothetical protein